jgi:rhodanese-related sulfurtransferase
MDVIEMPRKVEMPRKDVPPPLELVRSRIEEVLPPDAREEIEGGGVTVIDVRDPDRFERGHLAGAVSISSGESASDAHDTAYAESIESAVGGRDRRVILYCGEGKRSARTADALRNQHGFENVVSIIGGLKLWSDLGYPVEGEVAVGDDAEGGESGGEAEG